MRASSSDRMERLHSWGAAGAVLFSSPLARANRSPFDLPEAESEIVAGYFTGYSGFKFALFFLGEYLGLFAVVDSGSRCFSGWLPHDLLLVIPSLVVLESWRD